LKTVEEKAESSFLNLKPEKSEKIPRIIREQIIEIL